MPAVMFKAEYLSESASSPIETSAPVSVEILIASLSAFKFF